MRINTYKESTAFERFASILRKEGDAKKELAETVIKQIDEISGATPALKSALEGLRESVELAGRDSDDAMRFLSEAVQEISEVERKLGDGTILKNLQETEEALEAMTRRQLDAYRKHQALKRKNEKTIPELKQKYEAAVQEALNQKGAAEAAVQGLREEIGGLAAGLKGAQVSLAKETRRSGELIKQLKNAEEALAASQKSLSETTGALDLLKQQHAELLTKYENLLRGADEAADAARAARESGASEAVVEGLEATNRTMRESADAIVDAITQGNASLKEALEAEAKAGKRAAREVGEEVAEEVGEEAAEVAGTGWLSGIKNMAKGAPAFLLDKTAPVGRLLGTIGIYAVIGTALWYGGSTLWSWWTNLSINDARERARNFDAILRDAHAKLSVVKFKAETRSQQYQESYLDVMASAFGLVPEMVERHDDPAFISEAGKKLQILCSLTENYLDLKDVYQMDLETSNGWPEAIQAIQKLDAACKSLAAALSDSIEDAKRRVPKEQVPTRGTPDKPSSQKRPEPAEGDRGIEVLGQKVYLSQYPELSPDVRSAAPVLIKRVLLSPTGLSFWDPEGKWGGGYLNNTGSISDQVIRHIKFFMNPRAIDRNWAYGPINNERKLRKFMRKNMPKAGRRPGSGYKSTRREYKRKRPTLAFSGNNNISSMDINMNTRKNRLKMLEKIANSTNSDDISMKNIDKFADKISKDFYRDALRGLDDQYAKSYYTGLKSMYDQKLGGDKADYRSLYEPNGGTGTEILQESHPESIVVSDAMGRGGLVENVLEQQRHNIGVALSAPTGNFRGKHANLVDKLVKIANDNEEAEASKLIDEAIADIVTILKS